MNDRPTLSTGVTAALAGVVAGLCWWLGRSGVATSFTWPLRGRLTDGFGMRTNPITGKHEQHNGIDLATPVGTRIVAPAPGTIQRQYYNAIGGNQLIIDHGNGYMSTYAHLSRFVGKPGDTVLRGGVIGYSGNTGRVTGPHLHFGLRHNGIALNPLALLA